MPKTSAPSKAVQPATAHRLFPTHDVAGIVKRAGGLPSPHKENEFGDRLEEIGHSFLHSRLWQQKTAPSDIAKKLSGVERAAGKLLSALDISGDASPNDIPRSILVPLRRAAELDGKAKGGYLDFPPREWGMEGSVYTHYRGIEKLRSVVSSVRLLREWAGQEHLRARDTVERNVKDARKRYSGDAAMQEFIGGFAGVWLGYFNRLPAASVGPPESATEGQAGGPFVRFIFDCLGTMRRNLAPDDLANDPGLKDALAPSEYTVRERIRRLGISRLKSNIQA